ncbi:MAG: YwaF family protein [Bacilli bacterium]|nr:YwaF family protein [Bacilli bacterium]
MSGFYHLMSWLSGTMERPGNYGWFHIMFIGIVIVVTGLIVHFFKDANDKTFRRIAFIVWITIILFEVYKILVFSFHEDGDDISKSTWGYQWYAFPFQLCSTPYYVLPFVIFMPEKGKITRAIRRACMYYTATFAFFGGLCVYVFPNDVFVTTIGINIQTMIHHGSQVLMGVYTAVYMRKDFKIKEAWTGVLVFAALSSIAIILNEVMYYGLGEGEKCNMFFISPHFPCTLPLLSLIYPKVPHFVFLIIYLLGFTLVGGIIFYAEKGIISIVYRNEMKQEQSEEQKA